jgi:hypothetical protein
VFRGQRPIKNMAATWIAKIARTIMVIASVAMVTSSRVSSREAGFLQDPAR